MSTRFATAAAPASVGNVGVGFDLLGHAFEGAGDRATVRPRRERGVEIRSIRGVFTELPLDPARNTAGRALLSLLERARVDHGFELELEKGIALGSGMGGSASSAVAAAVAGNAVLATPLSEQDVYECALDGESVATNSRQGDNVAPILLGGLVLAPREGAPVRVPVPAGLWCALAHPHFVLETRVARAALAGAYELQDFVTQSEGLALVLAGCFGGDLDLVRRGLRDVLVEPRRARLVPGFASVKRAALEAGALGASISGAGPSVFAWCEGRPGAERAAQAMSAAFAEAGLASDRFVSCVAAPGARLVASGA